MKTADFKPVLAEIQAQLQGKVNTFEGSGLWVFHDNEKGLGLSLNIGSTYSNKIQTFTLEDWVEEQERYSKSQTLTDNRYHFTPSQQLTMLKLLNAHSKDTKAGV